MYHFDSINLQWHQFIHSSLVSCSLIGSLVNTQSVKQMYNALRLLRPGCSRCFCCVILRIIVTSTDPLFHWVKLLIFFMLSGILKQFYLWMILFFCRVWIRSIHAQVLLLEKWLKSSALALMLIARPMHSPSVHVLDEQSTSATSCTGF